MYTRESFQRECVSVRPYLLQYATFKLGDEQLAQDVVQDTLLAAFEGLTSYEARASARTWISAILRHKITDAIRAAYDERKRLDRSADVEDETIWRGNSPLTGHHRMSEDPLASLERASWLRLIDAGMRRLPPRAAKVFLLTECLGMNAGEVCRALSISESNVWVSRHRARKQLREFLRSNLDAPTGPHATGGKTREGAADLSDRRQPCRG